MRNENEVRGVPICLIFPYSVAKCCIFLSKNNNNNNNNNNKKMNETNGHLNVSSSPCTVFTIQNIYSQIQYVLYFTKRSQPALCADAN